MADSLNDCMCHRCMCSSFYYNNYNNTPQDAKSSLLLEKIHDVAGALAQIMMICGIAECKARASIEVIVHVLQHFDEIRQSNEAMPKKRICKEDLIHNLGCECRMSRMEALLAHSIVKRAFKALYHGTCYGMRSPTEEADPTDSEEDVWMNAAVRTVQILVGYASMFPLDQDYEAKIKRIYSNLYHRLKQKANPAVAKESTCSSSSSSTAAASECLQQVRISEVDSKSEDSVLTATTNKHAKIENESRIGGDKSFDTWVRVTKLHTGKIDGLDEEVSSSIVTENKSDDKIVSSVHSISSDTEVTSDSNTKHEGRHSGKEKLG